MNLISVLYSSKPQSSFHAILWPTIHRYCDGGSLFEALQVSGRLNEKIARRCMSGIIDGLAFLHNLGIIHGDLRAANILTAQNGEVKLINYGLFIQDHIKPDLKPGLGIPLWTAPEVLETNLVTPFSDVWSLGCTLVELLTGEGPYRSVSSVESCKRAPCLDCLTDF